MLPHPETHGNLFKVYGVRVGVRAGFVSVTFVSVTFVSVTFVTFVSVTFVSVTFVTFVSSKIFFNMLLMFLCMRA